MKTKKFSKKLTLQKATIADLNKSEMKDVHGGIYKSWRITDCNCPTYMSNVFCC